MPTLQDDLLEIYNSLVMFSDDIIKSKFPLPLRVRYEKESRNNKRYDSCWGFKL